MKEINILIGGVVLLVATAFASQFVQAEISKPAGVYQSGQFVSVVI